MPDVGERATVSEEDDIRERYRAAVEERSDVVDPDELGARDGEVLDISTWLDLHERSVLSCLEADDRVSHELMTAVRRRLYVHRRAMSPLQTITRGYRELSARLRVESLERREVEEEARNATHSLSLERSELARRVDERTQALLAKNVELEEEVRAHGESERALRLSHQRMAWALDAAHGGFWLHELETGRLELSSDLAVVIGLPPGRLEAEGWLSRIHADDRAQFNVGPPTPSKPRAVSHYRIRHETRGEILVQQNAHGVYEDERLVAVHGFVFDVSHLNETQQELMKNGVALVRVNRELERFTQLATHDLQEPLRHVQTFASMLEGNASGEDEHRVEALSRNVRRMREMLKDMREYVTFLHYQEPRPRRVEVEVLLDSVERRVRGRFPDAAFSLSVQPGLPAVKADLTLLFQLFEHLLANAVEYRSPDRHLEVEVTGAKVEDQIRLDLRDSGMGVSPRHREAIFQPLRRLHPGMSRRGGTGMGLAIARRIVEAHDGWVYLLWSTPDEGSCFRVQLPAAEAKAPGPADRGPE